MKSLEKFQYDCSPHTNEEVEELEEISLVGMVRSGGQAVKNVLKQTPKAIKSGSNAVQQGIQQTGTNLSNVVKNQTKKVERVQQRAVKKVDNAVKNNAAKRDAVKVKDAKVQKNLRALNSDKKRVRTLAQNRIKKDPSLGQPSLGNRIKNFGYKDDEKRKDLLRGGINSKLARNVGSVAKAVGQGISQPPANKISYNQKGDGYSGAFGGLGDNVKQVASNVVKAPSFSSASIDKSTGQVTKGGQTGTVGDKISQRLTGARSQDTKASVDKVEVTKGKSVTGLEAKDKERNKKKQNQRPTITGDTNNTSSKPKKNVPVKGETPQIKTNRQKGDELLKKIQNNPKAQNTQLTDRTDQEIEDTKSTGDEMRFARDMQRSNDTVNKEGKPIGRFGKEQPYMKINPKKKNKNKPKITGNFTDDGFPAGKDATHYLDAEKQHSSKTPKLFEQFLFEIDTRSTKKKKKKDGRGMHPHDEIKPMRGTNVITNNPEDETSKYKRGY